MLRRIAPLVAAPALLACGTAAPQRAAAPAPEPPPARTAPLVAATEPVQQPRAGTFVNEDDTDRQIRELEKAHGLYQSFIERAGDQSKYRAAVEVSRQRQEDIRATLEFLRAGKAEAH